MFWISTAVSEPVWNETGGVIVGIFDPKIIFQFVSAFFTVKGIGEAPIRQNNQKGRQKFCGVDDSIGRSFCSVKQNFS